LKNSIEPIISSEKGLPRIAGKLIGMYLKEYKEGEFDK